MLTVSSALRSIFEENTHLQFCGYHRLLNQSQTALYLQPLLEARLKRAVSPASIMMGLSRMQKDLPESVKRKRFHLDNIAVHSDLRALTFFSTPDLKQDLQKLYLQLKKRNCQVTITEGSVETMVIIDNKELVKAREVIRASPKFVSELSTCLSLRFDMNYLNASGFLYQIFEELALRSVVVRQLASTSTELIIYVDGKDSHLAFEILFKRLGGEKTFLRRS